MTDLWTEASRDLDAERLDTALTTARVAAAQVWPFLAQATTLPDFANRKALVAERIERIASAAAENDPALFGAVHAGLLDGLDEDFRILHTAQVAQRLASLAAARQAARKTAGDLSDLPEAMQEKAKEKKGEGESEGESSSASEGDSKSDSDEMPEFIKEKIEDDKKESSRTSAKSDECPRCGAKVEAVQTEDSKGKRLDATCDSCGWSGTKRQSAKTASGDAVENQGRTCATCGDSIEKDSSSEDNSTWHHNNGEKHDHEAKPGSKESARKTAGWLVTVEGDNDSDEFLVPTEDVPTNNAQQVAERAVEYASDAGIVNPVATEVRRLRPGVQAGLGSRKVAGENPFADQGNDNTKPVEDEQTGTWTCPNCSATDAYTQGGKDLDEALKAGEPIKCGSCQQVDSSGGSASQQQAPAPTPGVPGAQATRRTAAEDEECPDCGGTGSVPAGGGEDESEVDNGHVRCGTCGGTGRVPFSLYGGDRTFESRRLIASGYTPSKVVYEVRDNDRLIASVPSRDQAMRILMERGEWEGFGSTYDSAGNKTGDGLQVWEVTTGGTAGYDTAMDQHMDPRPAGEKRIAARGRRPFARSAAAGDNPYAGGNPYRPNPQSTQVGIPEDQTDGPAPVPTSSTSPAPTQPVSTRPRQQPQPVRQGFASLRVLQEQRA